MIKITAFNVKPFRIRFYVSDCYEGAILAASAEAAVERWRKFDRPISDDKIVDDFDIYKDEFEDPNADEAVS